MSAYRLTSKGQQVVEGLTPAYVAQRLMACQEGEAYWAWLQEAAHAQGDAQWERKCLRGQRFYQGLATTWRALLAGQS